MDIITDTCSTPLNKERIDYMLMQLNKALRKKCRNRPKDFKIDLYIVGGACIVAEHHTRDSTTDIDAMWTAGAVMKDCIHEVGDRLGLGHDWCNSDFRKTKSYTDAVMGSSHVYKAYDRLIVRMANDDLLLAMKLVAFREHKRTDMDDCTAIITKLRDRGIKADSVFLLELIRKYYGSTDVLSERARTFIGIGG